MKLYEVLDRDPRTARLANNGQARIENKTDAKAVLELRAELETFVCEGQFGNAIQLILERYLGNLGHTKQDSAWVSGFFGSGKSHLLKMLTHLWSNTEFEDGSTARSLVRGGLPAEVEAHLRELDTQARRTGLAPVAAAGTLLGGNDRVRETVLSILLRATGWPTQYPQAEFCFWLRDQGWLDEVRAAVEKTGRDWNHELHNFYVSPPIRKALLAADPSLAPDERGIGEVLQSHCPQLTTDITTEQFTEAAKQALQKDGEFPLTLLVLDEVQQYINEASDRAATITEVAEALQTQFDSRVMLVGAGQSALSAGTQALLWLRDRFKISIELADADVEAVTRKVLLHKKPSAEPEIEAVLERNAGEIARHLQGTKIGHRSEDQKDRVGDYPLLPTRRRFWEACFRAADAAGTQSQLRSQLRILHDSLHAICERDLGAVVPASDLFNALAPALVNTGALLNEINTRIQKLDDGTQEGRLRRDLCGLVFLIGKLPHESGFDLGVRANATVLADLMVPNVAQDSGPFRNRVAKTLEKLADDGTLMQVGEEYRLQTTEGAEWDRLFREQQTSLRQNEVEIATRRDHLFGQFVQEALGEIKLTHGAAKIRRGLTLHLGGEPPRTGGDHLCVWLRDGWSCAEKDAVAEARRLGQDDPTLHIHLPMKSADDLKGRIIDAEAARRVLEHHGVTTTPEGQEARDSMESRLRAAEASRDAILREVLHAAKVLQGGGSEVFGESLVDKLRTGAVASLARLFPRFDDADHRAFEVAIKHIKDGSGEPFKVVGWDQPTEDHPVSKEVLAAVGTGARGSEIQKTLKAAPFGWPQDAIDAALLALHRSGHLSATKNGQAIPVGGLFQAGVKAAEFRPEKVRLTTKQRIELRGLFAKAEIPTKPGEEELRAPAFLDAVSRLVAAACGDAPFPAQADTKLLEDLRRLTGAEQLVAMLGAKAAIVDLLRTSHQLSERRAERATIWSMAESLYRHATALPIAAEIGTQLEAIREQRSLLAETDHISPLCAKLAGALREALTKKHADLGTAIESAEAQLAGDATWRRLDASVQAELRRSVGLEAPAPLSVGTDAALLDTLSQRPLAGWRDAMDAVPGRVARARNTAAEYLEKKDPTKTTTRIAIRRGTLTDEAQVRQWLVEHETKLLEAITNGPVIVN